MNTAQSEKIKKGLALIRPCMLTLILDTIANVEGDNADRVLGRLQQLRDFYNIGTAERTHE